jgi:hypothetical protein
MYCSFAAYVVNTVRLRWGRNTITSTFASAFFQKTRNRSIQKKCSVLVATKKEHGVVVPMCSWKNMTSFNMAVSWARDESAASLSLWREKDEGKARSLTRCVLPIGARNPKHATSNAETFPVGFVELTSEQFIHASRRQLDH